MPEMNGIELSKKIKTDSATSHIPIILLTAMTTIESELEGFQAGANDYSAKPFTFELLESRIKNLLYLRLQMQKKFQKQRIKKRDAAGRERDFSQRRSLLAEFPTVRFQDDGDLDCWLRRCARKRLRNSGIRV